MGAVDEAGALLGNSSVFSVLSPGRRAQLLRDGTTLTLVESYRLGAAYEYGRAFQKAATEVLGEELGGLVHRHISLLQDAGRDRLGTAALRLRERYSDFDHPGAREIVSWLDGDYRTTSEMIEAQ